MSIIKGARNLEAAKKFYEWALTPGAQQFGVAAKQFQLPSNKTHTGRSQTCPTSRRSSSSTTTTPSTAPSAERRRLIAKWEKEVNSLPR